MQAVKGMRDVQTRLAQGKSDAITQHVQRQVVADLQQIIDEAKKSGKCLGQPMAGNCNKPGKLGGSPNAQPKSNTANDRPARESNPNVKQEPKLPQTERTAIARDKMKEQYKLELQAPSVKQCSNCRASISCPSTNGKSRIISAAYRRTSRQKISRRGRSREETSSIASRSVALPAGHRRGPVARPGEIGGQNDHSGRPARD